MEIRYARGKKYDPKMEKWSAMHNTYKFFNLGRPPSLEKIEKSVKIKKRILLLNKIKNYGIKRNLSHPDFKGLKLGEIDKKISNWKKEDNDS